MPSPPSRRPASRPRLLSRFPSLRPPSSSEEASSTQPTLQPRPHSLSTRLDPDRPLRSNTERSLRHSSTTIAQRFPPPRATVSSPASLPSSASIGSPAQRYYLKRTPAPVPQTQDAFCKKKSLSPASRDYQLTDFSAYGRAMRRKKALLIGIGYRDHKVLEELPGCANDLREMWNLLTGPAFAFPETGVKVLSDDMERIGACKVEQPTRENIIRGLRWLTEELDRGDSAVFFFAGHGDYTEDVSGDEDSGFDQCILPVDFMPAPKHTAHLPHRAISPILDDTIYERLVRAVPGGAKVTAVVDACRSGTVCDLPVVYDTDGTPRRRNDGKIPREWKSPHQSAGGTVLFSGAADNQLSIDMTVEREEDGGMMSFGVMTRSFVEAVREMVIDRKEGYRGVEDWSYGKLYGRVRQLVKMYTGQVVDVEVVEAQEPQLSSSHPNVWDKAFSM